MNDLELLRAYEPVLVHTQGEMFYPCSVDGYLQRSSLWVTETNHTARQLAGRGEVTAENIGTLSGSVGSGGVTHLRFVEKPMAWREYLEWRTSPDRPSFSAIGRWARVGLFSRLVDAAFDIALTLRGVVPGGTTAVAQEQYRDFEPDVAIPTPTYYGRVVREGGWVALQYWFFYAMNDFRSTFFGVNDHEGDWEQIIVYLPSAVVDQVAPAVPEIPPTWVAYAAHDLSGDDLRRRTDDPGLELIDGRHPVVYVGAGSHASYFEPGEYLFAVSPRALIRISDTASTVRRLWREVLGQGSYDPAARSDHLPWSIPFVDYARGDGARIGPGESLEWSPVAIDGSESWVSDYRGLWGLDTRDPLGGERAPAGPKFERNGSVRRSWSDVLGFAGMNKVIPDPELATTLVDRVDRLIEEKSEVEESIEESRQLVRDQELDRLAVEAASASRAASAPMAEQEREAELRLHRLVARRAELDESIRAGHDLQRRLEAGESTDPRAHIDNEHRPQPVLTHLPWIAETWAALSGGLLLIAVISLALSDIPHRFVIIALTVIAFLGVDAAMRGRGIRFLLNYTIVMAIVAAFTLMITHWQLAILVPGAFVVYSTARGNLRELRSLRAVRRKQKSSDTDEPDRADEAA